jgi:hypothetical protein
MLIREADDVHRDWRPSVGQFSAVNAIENPWMNSPLLYLMNANEVTIPLYFGDYLSLNREDNLSYNCFLFTLGLKDFFHS